MSGRLKISMLVLVIAMNSIGTGQLMFLPDTTTVQPGDMLVVQIVNDATGLNSYQVGAVSVTGPVDSVTLGVIPNPPLGGLSSSGVLHDGSMGGIWTTGIFGSIALQSPAVDADTAVYDSFTIQVSDTAEIGSLITIDDYSGTNPFGGPPLATQWNTDFVNMDSIDIEIVPEPVTLGLLGLGALMLRRRRT